MHPNQYAKKNGWTVYTKPRKNYGPHLRMVFGWSATIWWCPA